MPGINAAELAQREKDIAEDMCRIHYSKRYQDLTHEYRYILLIWHSSYLAILLQFLV